MFSTSFKQAFSLAERVRNAGSGARYLGSNPASATSCLGQPQALLTLSVSQVAPLSKANSDQSTHSMGWEAKWVNLQNLLGQFLAHGS